MLLLQAILLIVSDRSYATYLAAKTLSVLEGRFAIASLFMCIFSYFYRAMHQAYSAKRGIAIACRLSVCDVDGS